MAAVAGAGVLRCGAGKQGLLGVWGRMPCPGVSRCGCWVWAMATRVETESPRQLVAVECRAAQQKASPWAVLVTQGQGFS